MLVRIERMMLADAEIRDSQQVTHASWPKVLLVLTVVGAHLPLLTSHLAGLWHRPHFRFLPLLMLVCIYLFWRRWPRRSEVPYVAAPVLELALAGLSIVLLAAGILLNSPFLGTASAIFAIGYLVISFAGVRVIESCIGVWALLWVLLPPPLGYDLALIARLQSWTSARASEILDLLSIDHLMSGNVLTMANTTFFVDEACSGVHSLFALVGYTAVFVVYSRRGLRRSLLLLAATIPWALFLNVIRIVTIAIGHSRFQIDLSTGWLHEVLGFLTFVLALAMTLSTDQLLGSLGYGLWTVWMALRRITGVGRRRSRGASSGVRTTHRRRVPLQKIFRWPVSVRVLSLTALCIYGVMGLTQVTGATATGTSQSSWEALSNLNEETLPKSLCGFDRQVYEIEERDWSSDLGRSSQIWTYGNQRMKCVLSLDFPFFGWHELTRCYAGLGWQLKDREVESHSEDGWHAASATLTNETGETAILVYGFLNERGEMLAPPAELGVKRIVDRIQRQSALQIQVFCPSTRPLSASDREQVRAVFRQAVQRAKPVVSESARR
ncbi:MAG: exosortase U [Planctomycetaceae bacterium]|nr:exosortase U [Planctomycetaceae bacterium]